MMKKQILMFLKYFLSIQDGTFEKSKDSKIHTVYFNPEFHKAMIKQQYIGKDDKTFRGYPLEIETEKGADYWGMDLEPIKN